MAISLLCGGPKRSNRGPDSVFFARESNLKFNMAVDVIVEQIVPSGVLTGIKFGFLTGDDMEKFSTVNIVETSDVTSAKLGMPNASSQCATCGSRDMKDCDGHFGLIKFPAVTFHPYFMPEIVHILNRICPGCKSVKQDIRRKVAFILENNNTFISDDAYDLEAVYKSLSGPQRKLLKIISWKFSLPKSVLSLACFKRYAKRKKRSPDKWYPQMKFKLLPVNVGGKKSISIIAEVCEKLPKRFRNRELNDLLPKDYWDFAPKDPKQQQGPIKGRMTLSPAQVFSLLKELDPEYVKRFVSDRELLFLSCLTVTPNRHRVMEVYTHADGPRLFFDERTKSFKRLVDLSRKFDELHQNEEFGVLASSHITSRVLDCLNMSKLLSQQSPSGHNSSSKSGLRWVKEIVLGKRSDNIVRMVVVGDPKIRLNEIGVPLDISENMFVSEHVNAYNFRQFNNIFNMQLLMKEELYVRRKGKLTTLRKANQLHLGDVFYRPLENGDIVLINRNPSVHQHSLIAFSVKVLPNQSVFSLNPLCCAPFNGDFDGDCLHGFIPQSIQCRVELGQLVTIDCQLSNAQDGRSLLSLTFDSLTAAHLLTGCDIFLNKLEMQQLGMLCLSELPPPAILRAPGLKSPLWTGRQLLDLLLPEMANKCYEDPFAYSDQSRWLQNTSSGLFSQMFKTYGKKALDLVFVAQDVLCEWMSARGFSVSLGDIYLSSDPYSRSKMIDEVSYGLEEAETASHIKKLLMDSELGLLMKSNEGTDDSLNLMNHTISSRNSVQVSKASIAAFKDVFHDIQSAVHQHVSKDNSMLAMVHAGSKGSILKLVQQGACLGLQLFPTSLPSRMPLKLPVSLSNHQNYTDQWTQDTNFAVVKACFLDGLNPLECFIHAISSRDDMFSMHAEVPGTLTRKLMFYMRDLYVAYDGTVRSACGQRIVQFSYYVPEETSSNNNQYYEEEIGRNSFGGLPVGSVAACAVSEAAYGALDRPINGLEASPLMNLKKVLECRRSSKTVDHAISITLSKKLKRWAYGLEYGALEVKDHLEPVLFSDLVSTTMVVYAAYDNQLRKYSPWVLHFHVNKEKMLKKKLTLDQIIDALMRNHPSAKEKGKTQLPPLCIRSDDCFIDDSNECDMTLCISVAVEISEVSQLLDTMRDVLMPMLLQTLIKGYLEVQRVDILWDSQPDSPDPHGELFLKVIMSDKCAAAKFWCTLVDACLPIMDLIDWNRSHPDSIYDVSTVYGIDVGWRYFFQGLKSAMSDTGRSIRREHLLVVADRLSVTGQFHGLNSKGLKLQKSVSIPFTQACFTRPGDSFIKAAKEGSVDHLSGTIDSMAWGKEPPIGTGGPFEIIYSGMVPVGEKSESVYETLSCLKSTTPSDSGVKFSRHDYQKVTGKRKWQKWAANAGTINGQLNDHQISDVAVPRKDWASRGFRINRDARNKHQAELQRSEPNSKASMGFEPKPFPINIGCFADVVDLSASLRTMLHEYPLNGVLNNVDTSSFMRALHYHPRKDQKLGVGIQDIKVGHHPSHPGSRCFILVRTDGSTEDISYRKCVIGAAQEISPECASAIEKKLYHRRSM